MFDKSQGACVPISQDIGTLTQYCTLTRMHSHITITLHCFWWRRNVVTLCQTCHAHFCYQNSVLKVRNTGKWNKFSQLYNKRLIVLILVNILSMGYLWTLTSLHPSISQLGTIFTNISAITLYYHNICFHGELSTFFGWKKRKSLIHGVRIGEH